MSFQDELFPLATREGSEWLMWFGAAAELNPELKRSLQALQEWVTLVQPAGSSNDPSKNKTLLARSLVKFLGQSKVPSASTCEKLAFRTRILSGWFESELSRSVNQAEAADQQAMLLNLLAGCLERLFGMCAAADDKRGYFTQAVRHVARVWLKQIQASHFPVTKQAEWIFPVAMSDAAGVVQPEWWWKALSLTDEQTVLYHAELLIGHMDEMQPTSSAGWRSYDKRWQRLRLKALLTYINEKHLLSELLRKSAVDDFEAAQAVRALVDAGRQRQAIQLGEGWLRAFPRSSVLAESLFSVYAEDGWDEEALDLARNQFALDPSPRWVALLEKYFPEKADSLASGAG